MGAIGTCGSAPWARLPRGSNLVVGSFAELVGAPHGRDYHVAIIVRPDPAVRHQNTDIGTVAPST